MEDIFVVVESYNRYYICSWQRIIFKSQRTICSKNTVTYKRLPGQETV